MIDRFHHDLDQESEREAAAPLYLAPEGEAWVGLDGPALRVSRLDRAERIFPLRRIARVHTSPRVDSEQAALLACADAGIPVLFGSGQRGSPFS
jgi:hypothetical protein